MNNSETFKAGTRIYYTGDMANSSSFGTIESFHPATKYQSEGVIIKYDDSRFEGDTLTSNRVPCLMFSPSPGRRFWLADEYKADQKAKMNAFSREYFAKPEMAGV